MTLTPDVAAIARRANAAAASEEGALLDAQQRQTTRFKAAGPALSKVLQGQLVSDVCDGAPTTGRMGLNASIDDLVSRQGGTDGTLYDVSPTRADGLYNAPTRPLRLLSVLPHLVVDSNAFEFIQLSGYINKADYQVNEGDTKAQGAVPTALQTANIATIAHWVRTSSQVLSDAPALQQQVGNLLDYGTLAKLESELVVGPGGKGKILGLLPSAMPATTTEGLGMADRVGEAITQLEVDGWVPGVVIMNPNDWQTIRAERDNTGQYIGGGWARPGRASVWNLPVITTPSLPANTALVLDPQQVMVLDRMQPVLMVSREDGNNFTTNRVTILSELRAGLAVMAPYAVLKVTLTGTPATEQGTAESIVAAEAAASALAGV